MSIEGEYTLELRRGGATLSGVMRLLSPAAYRSALAGIHELIEGADGEVEIDLSGLTFLNSSGITALSRIVLLARERKIALTVVIDDALAWQRKTLPSLAKLYPGVQVRGRA